MLIRHETLRRIASGEVDTVFRRQRRPTVKAGGTLRTMIGMLAIDAVERIEPEAVTESDARRAGMTRDEILAMLAAKADGECYRVRLHVAGADRGSRSARTPRLTRRRLQRSGRGWTDLTPQAPGVRGRGRRSG